jgi:uncharacterized protein (DUF885 family)
MKQILFTAIITAIFFACSNPVSKTNQPNAAFGSFLDNYYEGRLKLNPLEATFNGDNRYNDVLFIDISEAERGRQKQFYQAELDTLKTFDYDALNENDKLSYDVLNRDLTLALQNFGFHDNYLPINQFTSLPLTIGQLASGQGAQPFKAAVDYKNWLKRLDVYARWLDTSIVYFKKGIDSNIVLPKSLVIKIIPQLQAMTSSDTAANLFFSPLHTLPDSFSAAEKQELREQYQLLILQKIIPAYKRVVNFLQNEYLPHARATSGISDTKNGADYYRYCIENSTTTNKTADEIYNTGLAEVARIRGEMEKIKDSVGFKGDLKAFLEYLKTNKKFMPYKKPAEIINAFQNIYSKLRPNLPKLFSDTPFTKFEIRQTEAFRAASASAEYNPGTPDGSRPGIFYIPIVDAAQFNTTSGMESLFLHEAIPGHHYQVSLQQENKTLPLFRRFGGNNAYVEGWALYCESLGKELGLYTDPYQYMGALSDEMHRAIRLEVDVAIHTKNMSREEAIAYMFSNGSISEEGATSEIERYMAWPGQALGYKIGALKIAELRRKFEKQQGTSFQLAEFHRQVLKDGALPLNVLEAKLSLWAATVKK